MNAYADAVYSDITLKIKKFLVEERKMKLLLMVPRTSSMHLLTILVREMDQTGAKLLLILVWVELTKFMIVGKQEYCSV